MIHQHDESVGEHMVVVGVMVMMEVMGHDGGSWVVVEVMGDDRGHGY